MGKVLYFISNKLSKFSKDMKKCLIKYQKQEKDTPILFVCFSKDFVLHMYTQSFFRNNSIKREYQKEYFLIKTNWLKKKSQDLFSCNELY